MTQHKQDMKTKRRKLQRLATKEAKEVELEVDKLLSDPLNLSSLVNQEVKKEHVCIFKRV